MQASLEVSHRTEMERVGWPLLWSAIAGMMLGWADTIMLGAMAGANEAGIYAVAFRVAIFSSLARQIAARVAIGRFAAAIAVEDEREQQRLLAFITHVGLVAAPPIAVLAFAFPDFILGLAGEEFKQGALVLSVIVAGELVSLLFGSPGAALQVSGHHKLFSRCVWATLALNIALNAILIPTHGALGAAIATATTGLLQKLLMAGLVIRLTGNSTLAVHSAFRAWKMARQSIQSNRTETLREKV
jgi:O-antigen/teichoic acid export membrane protein